MNNKTAFRCVLIVLFACVSAAYFTGEALALEETAKPAARGMWVTCFSKTKALYSKKAALELVELCNCTGVNEIYLQVYRAGQAYYDSKITDRIKYDNILKTANADTIEYLIEKAHAKGIKVFAWINVLSLADNRKAHIIKKFGESVLTKDQYLRASSRSDKPDKTDAYYLRDEQYFLEPGDPRVASYILSLVNEITARYPSMDGIHLDYLRYPYAIPMIPDSRFNKFGVCYGYSEENIKRFKEKTGLDPLHIGNERDDHLSWDNWKRGQITALVESISKEIKKKSPKMLLSCAVVPSLERAYMVVFQDWPLWLEKGIVDYVVIMNYTKDNRWIKETAKADLSQRGKGRVFIGMGLFLLKNEPDLFRDQYKSIKELKPDGIVFFSCDDILDKKELVAEALAK